VYGLIKACWIVGMIGGAWIAAAVIRRLSRDVQLAWMLMACLAGVGLVCFGQGLPLFSVLLLVPLNLIGGLFNAGENSTLGIAVARRVPEAFRGRANAAVGGRINAAQLIGFLLGGAMSTVLDVRVAFMTVGLVSIGIVVACLPIIRRAADGDGPEDSPVSPSPERDLAGATVLTPLGPR
jgi:MFS family permease